MKVFSKSVTTPAIITTAMMLVNQNYANKFWDRSHTENFSKKTTWVIVAKSVSRARAHMQMSTIGFFLAG